MELNGKVIVVTGGADGIGAALCRRFAKEGAAHVAVVDRNAEGAKAVAAEAEGKMRRAGASAVVSPNTIGGRRMVSELVRPEVVEFLDQMHRADHSLRLEEIQIPGTSSLVGKMLRDAALRPRTKALVIATRDRDGMFHYNPGPETRIASGMILIVLGDREDVEILRSLIA